MIRHHRRPDEAFYLHTAELLCAQPGCPSVIWGPTRSSWPAARRAALDLARERSWVFGASATPDGGLLVTAQCNLHSTVRASSTEKASSTVCASTRR